MGHYASEMMPDPTPEEVSIRQRWEDTREHFLSFRTCVICGASVAGEFWKGPPTAHELHLRWHAEQSRDNGN